MSKYSILYADPPWHYEDRLQHNGFNTTGSALTHYPTMKLDELKALNIKGYRRERLFVVYVVFVATFTTGY